MYIYIYIYITYINIYMSGGGRLEDCTIAAMGLSLRFDVCEFIYPLLLVVNGT